MCIVSTLRTNLTSWENIEAPQHVLDWLQCGVEIPFKTLPKQFELGNHNLNKTQCSFIDREIHRLLENKYIQQCDKKPLFVSPIGCVPKKNNKYRLITDLRHLNSHCDTPTYKNEDIRTASQIVQSGDHFISVDIKDGFFHIPVSDKSRQFLGICWKNNYYVWNVLPFGLSCSPYYFAKTIRPIVAYLRSLGVRVTVYVDDFLLASHPSDIANSSDLLINTLQDLGFRINFEKSCIIPAPVVNYIGYTIDSTGEKVVVQVQHRRVVNIKHCIRQALNKAVISARQLAKIAGHCVSTVWAVSPGKLLLRNIYRLLSTRESWSSELVITNSAREELSWWLRALDHWNKREICTKPVEVQLVTDASHLGWGALCNGQVASGDWNQRVSHLPSNQRELLAILMAIHAFRKLLVNKHIQILTDNISAMAYINHKGGPVAALSKLATAIWAEAADSGICIQSAHIAGRKNIAADYWSRTPDKHNWMLHPKLFSYLDRLWGPHTVDRFANCQNAQLPRFNSRFWEPMSEGVDALAQKNWQHENNYVNAPFCLIPTILDIIQTCRATATIIAPFWPAQSWFNRLRNMAIQPPLQLPKNRFVYKAMGVTPEPYRNRKWIMHAWRIRGGPL